MKNRTLHYIIRFLVGDDVPSELVETIGYTADPNKFDRYNVVIIPSGFFDGQTYGVDFGMSMEDFPVKSPCPTGPVSCIVRSWMNIACCFIVGCANPGYVYPR